MSKIFLHQANAWGGGYYRAKSPSFNCYETLASKGIHLTVGDQLLNSEINYDAFIFHLIPNQEMLHFTNAVKEMGRKVVWNLDDDFWNVPDYVPVQRDFSDRAKFHAMVDLVDYIFVSTEPLARQVYSVMGKQVKEKIKVLPNLTDTTLFDTTYAPTLSDNPVRILWAGSNCHDEDLQQIIKPIKDLMEEFGDYATFIFFGYIPTEFADFERIQGSHQAKIIAKDYGVKLAHLNSVELKYYFDVLTAIRPHIAIAPLVDNVFNQSKSSIKFYEYSMAGSATIASNVAPYSVIEHERTGLLVDPGDEEGWKKAIRTLILNKKQRDYLAGNAKKAVIENYSWHAKEAKAKWIDAFEMLVSKE